MNPRYLTAPDHVVAADLGPATILVNYRAGNVETLIGPAARLWTQLARTGDADTLNDRDRRSTGALLDQLMTAGLLVATTLARPWAAPIAGKPWLPSWGTQELAAGYAATPRVPPLATVRAGTVLAVVLTALRIGRAQTRMARLTRLLAAAMRHTTRSASPEDAHAAFYAVRRAGLVSLGRVACLEESAAAALLLAITGQRVTWCHGATADPIRLHAWVQTEDGQRVAEPPSTARFTVLRTIPNHRQGGESH